MIPYLHGRVPWQTRGEETRHDAYLRESGQEKNCHWDGTPPTVAGDPVLPGWQRGTGAGEGRG